jgi:outer membrane cobalamin receptor
MTSRLICLALTLCSACLTLAQEKPDTTKTYYFNPINITATNVETAKSSVANAVSVVGREAIRNSGETSILPVVNKLVPGVFITERGVLGYGVSTGAAGGISIRGAGGSPNTEVLVLTDGRPQMMGLMGHPLPDTYVTAGVERVEIIRGPASLLHGTNAMAGVINVIPEQHFADGPGTRAGLSYGSFRTGKVGGSVNYGFDEAGLSASASYYSTAGHRTYSDFRITNGSLRGYKTLDEHFTLRGDVNISGFRTYDPGTELAPTADHWVDIVRGSSGFALENRHAKTQGAIKGFFNFGRHRIYDGFHSIDNNIGALAYQALMLFPDNILTVGIDFRRYGGRADNEKTGFDFGKFYINESAAYALAQQKALEIVTVSAGVRINHHSLYGDVAIPQFGIATQLTGQTSFRISAGKGFRSPTIRELYLFPAPTPTLRPEQMWNYELGFQHNFTQAVSMEIAGFVSEGSDIIRVGGRYPNLTLSNSGSFVHRGVEFSGTTVIAADWHVDATYGYLHAGDQTMASPRHKLYVGAGYETPVIRINAGMQHIAGLYGDDFSRNALPDYTIINARCTLDVSESFSYYIAGENILNARYQIMTGYPMPGATVFVGVNLNYQ